MLFKSSRSNNDKGAVGESVAAEFFRSIGFQILERNYRNRSGEIDLIAKKGKLLVFIEVKSRSSEQYGLPQEAVTFSKQKKIRDVALFYLQKKGLNDNDLEIRFDVVAIMLDGSKVRDLRHIPEAF